MHSVTMRKASGARTATLVGLALALTMSATAVAAASPPEFNEDHIFAELDGYRTGRGMAIDGDMVAYTKVLGADSRRAAVEIFHAPDLAEAPDVWEAHSTVLSPYTPSGSYLSADEFGAAIQLDWDARMLYVGAPGADDWTGAVYAFRYDDAAASWSLVDTITPNAPAGWTSDYFGETLDLADGMLVIGAPNSASPTGGTNAGLVYSVDLTAADLVAEPILYPQSTSDKDDILGQAVAVSANFVTATKPQACVGGKQVGGLYVWERDGGSVDADSLRIVEQPADPKMVLPGCSAGHGFGMSVGFLEDGSVLVSSPVEYNYTGATEPTDHWAAIDDGEATLGAVYRYDTTTLERMGPKLLPEASGESFGGRMAVGEDFVLITASHGPAYRGEIYVVDVNSLQDGDPSGWDENRQTVSSTQLLVPSDAQDDDEFANDWKGVNVVVSGNHALGSRTFARWDGSTKVDSGAVYLFGPLKQDPTIPVADVKVVVEDTRTTYGQVEDVKATASGAFAGLLDGGVEFTVGPDTGSRLVLAADGSVGESYPVTTHDAGSYAVTARYYGSASDSAEMAHGVGVLRVDKAATTTTATASPAEVAADGSVTVTGSVAAEHGTAPTGAVDLSVDGVVLATAALVAPVAPETSASYTATVDAAALGAGGITLVASYAGDTNHLVSASEPSVVQVGGTPTDPATPTSPTDPSEPAPTSPLPTSTDGGPAAGGAADPLAQTGSDVLPIVAGALALLLAGGVTVVVVRRRRSALSD